MPFEDRHNRRWSLRRVGTTRLPLVGIVLAAAYLAATYALQASQWAVMTDELQTSKLALSAAQTLSPVPRIHGQDYDAFSQLYPLLVAPFFGLLSAPDAVTAAHGLNALLFASAAVPAYLLGRDVTDRRAGGFVAAALTAFVPWLVLSTTLLTENAAYPTFVWAVWLCHRALVTPSLGRDAAALAGLALAFFARTQLFVLVLALPVAVLAHEIAFSATGHGRSALVSGVRRAVSRHILLVSAYAAAAVAAGAIVAAGRSLESLLGGYGQAARGNLFPRGIWHSAAVHLDYVVVGIGIAPFLLAMAWTVVALIRPSSREAHAFALLLALLVPFVTLEAASFDLRFTPGAFVQDRYLCYLAPLCAVGAAAAVLELRHRQLRAALVIAAGVAFLLCAGLASYGGTVLFWASPAAAFQRSLASASHALGLSLTDLVRIATAAFAVTLAALIWRAPERFTLVFLGVAAAGYGAAEAAYVADRVALPVTTRAITIVGARRDWVDAAVPDGSSVALLPNAQLGPEYWWDTEFWNKTVDRMLELDDDPRPTPFPVARIAVDSRTGRIGGGDTPAFVVMAGGESRLGLAGARTVATAGPVELVRVARPYRALWLTRGATPDGWALPRRPVRIRFFPGKRPGARRVVLTLSAFSGARSPASFTLRSGATTRRGRVPPATQVQVAFPVCVSRARPSNATLIGDGAVRLPDDRLVSLHIDRIQTSASTGTCGVLR
jgi:hypothetical protein